MENQPGVVRILIADDYPIFREGLRRLLESEPDFRVIGEAGDGIAALRFVRELHPDVALLDLAMPRLDGLGVLHELAGSLGRTRVILLVAAIERPDVLKALELEARGLILKEATAELLIKSVRCVVSGQYWIGRDTMVDLLQSLIKARSLDSTHAPERPFSLTQRELEVLELVATADSNKAIAQKLSLSEETVKHHLRNLFDKTGTSNRLELTLFALHHRLVRVD